jgi:hypothetical protein
MVTMAQPETAPGSTPITTPGSLDFIGISVSVSVLLNDYSASCALIAHFGVGVRVPVRISVGVPIPSFDRTKAVKTLGPRALQYVHSTQNL